MVEPVTAFGLAIAKTAAGKVGAVAGRKALTWAKGSEAQQLVKLLRAEHRAAHKMLVQPDALGELYLYAETGDFDADAFTTAVRPLTSTDEEARALAEAVRTTQWRVMRDERRTHFEVLRLRAELRGDVEHVGDRVLARLDETIAQLGRAVPIERQLPAATDRFVDRDAELSAAAAALEQSGPEHVARILGFAGMPGIGKSTLAIEVARRFMASFDGGVLYVDLRNSDGTFLPTTDIAARLLRDLGAAPEAIRDGDGAVAALRSLLAEVPVLLVLDNARDEKHVRDLVPANPDSIVLITSRRPLAGLGQAMLATLGDFAAADAIELLGEFVGARVVRQPEAAAAIADACHGLPLALAVVGARLRRQEQLALDLFAAELDNSLLTVDDPEATISAALQSGLEAASPAGRRALLLIAALDVLDLSPESIGVIAGLGTAETRKLLEELHDRQLLGQSGLHQLLRALLRELARTELWEDDVASAQERRVRWLVESGQPHIDDLAG